MTKNEVRVLYEEFSTYLAVEQQYREDLLKLRFYGNNADEDELSLKLQLHNEMVKAIELNRQENMLPILEILSQFIGAQTREQALGQLY